MIVATHTIGDFTVTAVRDGVFPTTSDIIIHPDGPEATAQAIADYGSDTVNLPVHCFIVQRGDDIVLVDTGAGTAWGDGYGGLRTVLADMGIAPDDVPHILITHTHGDHAFGLLDGNAAYFPNATVHVAEGEIGDAPNAMTQSVLAAYDGRIATVAAGPVFPDITLRALPGHTPGHAGFMLTSGASKLLLWGDITHLPALQTADPAIGVKFDNDKDQARATRTALLAELADSDTVIAGGHVTGFHRVISTTKGYALAAL